jgi:hypothetical protein
MDIEQHIAVRSKIVLTGASEMYYDALFLLFVTLVKFFHYLTAA